MSSLCEKLKCPATIPHGHISTFCSRNFNSYCYDYVCDSGYVLTSRHRTLKCNATGQWEWWLQYSTRDFCVNETDLCPGDIKNGLLDSSCERNEGDRCSFSCDDGCKKYSNTYTLTCNNRNWDVDTDLLCTDCLQCNHTVPHGSINMANCYAGRQCTYSCDSNLRHAKNENITSVTCSNATNSWVPSNPSSVITTENDLCLARHCSTSIPNGHLLSSCSAEVGSVCRYKCDLDYHGNVSEIYCLSKSRYTGTYLWSIEIDTYWSIDKRQLCTNSKQCPLYSIPHGSLDAACTRNPGDVCRYTCEYGYRSTHTQSNQTSVTCTSSSTWNASFSLLCEKIVCPSTIPNGHTSCYSSTYNQHCTSYTCDYGYQPSRDYPILKCNYEGQWEWDLKLKFCLGEEELCPSKINGGRISSYNCHRNEGSSCTYYCNGCRNDTAPRWLTCHNKTWDSDTRYLCTDCTTTTTVAPIRCPWSLPGGNVLSTCDRTPDTWCAYNCHIECTKQFYSIRCDSYGDWTRGNLACTCPTCPSYIPNGYISGSSHSFKGFCDFKSGSMCEVTCNEGCDVIYDSTFCESTGQWSNADNLCYCKNTDTSDEGSKSTVAIVMPIVGVIAFLIIVTGIIKACHGRRSQPTTQSTSVNQSGLQQPPYQITPATTSTQRTDGSSPTYFTNTSYIQGPPDYRELSFSKDEQSTPPPSYEDVSPHPLEVAQQTIDQTPVIENISTPL